MEKCELNPKNARSEEQIFADLTVLCQSPGYVHAVAYFCFRDNLIMYSGDKVTEADTQHQYSHDKLLRTEISTLIGLMVKNEIEATLPAPEILQAYVDRTEYLLHEMHMCLQKPWLAAFQSMAASGSRSIDPFSTAGGLREPIFYTGESAYNFQYGTLAELKYRADREWLLNHFGFSIENAVQIAEAISKLQIQKLISLRETLQKLSPDQWSFYPAFLFRHQEIAEKSNIDPEKIRRFLDAFSFSRESINAPFISLGSFNETNATPIISFEDGNYLLLQHYSLVESIYESPFFWMIGDESYRSTASINRGAFLEGFLADRLRHVFGIRHVYQNVDIYKGKDRVGEIDVLVLYGNAAIVVQAKSKRLAIESRKGNDLQLKSDFKKAIQDAYDQAWQCSNALLVDGHRYVLPDGNEINISKMPVAVFPICVVADHYPAIASQARQFLKSQTSATIHPAIITDVFFVDVMTEMLASPLHLLNYLTLRSRFDEKLLVSQELTNLGYHLKYNLWVEDKYNMVNLGDDFTGALDIAMTARRTGVPGELTPKGILTRFDGSPIGNLLKQIEAAASPELVGLGMMLLQTGSNSAKHINAGIRHMVNIASKDRKHHDFSIPFETAKSGFTIHVNSLEDDASRERLSAHCRLRKYDTKSDTWYGLLLFPGSGQIRGVLVIDEPWKHDPGTETALAKWQRKPMAPIKSLSRIPQKHKIGRNEQCPCGSGMKYKKCCLLRN